MHRTTTWRLLAMVLAAAILLSVTGCSRLGAGTVTSDGSSSAGPSVIQPSGEVARSQSAADAVAGGAAAPATAGTSGAPKNGYSTSSVTAPDRLVIRTGSLRLEVDAVTSTVDAIRAVIRKYGGVVSALTLSSDGNIENPIPLAQDGTARSTGTGLPYNASITALIPVAKSEAFTSEVEKLGTLRQENHSAQDVTQAHADLSARLANARAEEARLRSFFDRAKSVNDMLAIERELDRVRGDIESMTAQLKTLNEQTSMATLTIELVEPARVIQPTNGIDWGFNDALRNGVQGAVKLVKVGLIAVIALSPLWVLALVIILVVVWAIRARRARRMQSPLAGTTETTADSEAPSEEEPPSRRD